MKKLILFTGIITNLYLSANAQWVQQGAGFTTPLRGLESITIVSKNVAWAVAFDGSGSSTPIQEYTKTLDGGATWVKGQINAPQMATMNYDGSSITAIDANTAWVAMYDDAKEVGAIFKTINGGANWIQVTDTSMHFQYPGYANAVHFWDKDTGFAYGDPNIIKEYNDFGFEFLVTDNGGLTWRHVSTLGGDSVPYNLQRLEFGLADAIATYGSNAWVGTSQGRVYRSNDKGKSWDASIAFDTLSGTGVYGIAFKDNMNGLAVGHLFSDPYTDKGISRTADGGATWSVISGSVGVGGFTIKSDIKYVPGTAGAYIITGSHDPAYTGVATDLPGSAYTLDNGQTWINIDTLKHYGLEMYDLNTGWSGSFSNSTNTEGLFKWTNNNLIQAIGKHDMERNNQFLAFPNPATNVLNIHLLQKDIDKGSLTLTDMLGRTVYETQLNQTVNTVNLNNVKAGAYILNVSTETGASTSKIIVQ